MTAATRNDPCSRRVVLPEPAESTSGTLESWIRDRQTGRRTGHLHPIVRLADDGVDWGAEPGPGDEVGYAMDPNRLDSCFRAAIATVTQVPIEHVPELKLHEREHAGEDPDEINRTAWDRIIRWAAKRGLAVGYWDRVPVPRDRWIGVVANKRTEDPRRRLLGVAAAVVEPRSRFADHCLVMSHDRLIFNPLCSVEPPPGKRRVDGDPTKIDYGLSFEPMEE